MIRVIYTLNMEIHIYPEAYLKKQNSNRNFLDDFLDENNEAKS